MKSKMEIHTSTFSNGYESYEGIISGIPFRIGRYLNKFQEDLKENLDEIRVLKIFKEIDRLKKLKKLL